MTTLYKRNAQDKPLFWSASEYAGVITITHGLVGGTQHKETIQVTSKKGNELQSRINAKRKEGYKELTELKDSGISQEVFDSSNIHTKLQYLTTYLPKYSTTSEGFVLPMLAKVLKNNKPFEKCNMFLGQYKINGLRCIIGAKNNPMDMFNSIYLTYYSREGEDWTVKMSWMNDIIISKLDKNLIEAMVEEGVCLDGELYLPGYSINDINSFVKNTNLKQHYLLQYWFYDLCYENITANNRMNIIDKWCDKNSKINIKTKEDHLNNKNNFVILCNEFVCNYDEAVITRNKYINLGFEGLIIRNPNSEYQFDKRNQAMFKFKKVDDGKFIIVDITSEHKRKDLPLFVLRNDINEELFECSINKPQDVQREILINKEKYVGKYMVVEYRERSGVAQVPFHARGINIEN